MPCREALFNGGYGYHNVGGMIFMMGFGMIIFLAIVFIIFKLSKQNNNAFFYNDDNSALNILSERFAKGEINEEEYNKMKAALKK
ncbi:SHOCT domain-containing protein [Clostridium felsineum]|uniref:SHOCT domain-containing protein n=1 Tax=Clostridium felsineum TaxID=36839 RepID=UPI00098C4618|nr:SHOCT domain-containing protein [Clostridium felsineum]URZ02351.1 hypothetical protein CLAUR_023480 [Clostridium felsineum]